MSNMTHLKSCNVRLELSSDKLTYQNKKKKTGSNFLKEDLSQLLRGAKRQSSKKYGKKLKCIKTFGAEKGQNHKQNHKQEQKMGK